ncbi:MAG TPA: DegT/DnrJ/EryC1/StrS family aminotransferase [Pyrinomonadaceae bacterium]|nr:DegT/DnrJ/EryC1/StrS family aminotransferase [Pyrinomonadaceae bacterium]
MDWKIPLSDIEITEQDVEAVERVLRSKWLSMGAVTQEFERSFASFIGVKHAFAVTNATAALHLAYMALGLGPGDEVIAPSLTFVATANAILYTGARPVFADINGADDLNISASDIRRRITPRTKAITVMHYGGYVCDMTEIMAIADEYKLALIEDAAHAPGASLGDRKAGTFGDVACFSFFSNKNLTTGEGGMVVTDRDDLAERLRLMRSHGMTTLTWDRHKGHAHTYDVVALGYNYRIDEMRSALGLVQLEHLQQRNQRRQEIVDEYRAKLSETPGLSIPFSKVKHGSAHYIFPVLLKSAEMRGPFITELKAQGIQTSIHYPPVHLFEYYRERFDYAPGALPITEDACSRQVTLPLYPTMREGDIQFVCDIVNQTLSDLSRSNV